MPYGYWTDFANVEAELRPLISELGRMPSQNELAKRGFSSMTVAIARNHGGISAVAKRLGVRSASTPKPFGYWNDFTNVEKEIRPIIVELGRMPTHKELLERKRSSLCAAIRRFGTYSEVAKRLGVISVNLPRGYWKDFKNLEEKLRPYISKLGRMPSLDDLSQKDQGKLVSAIMKHGGFHAVAKKLGIPSADGRVPYRHWDDFANIETALRPIVAEIGRMPTAPELSERGLSGLGAAIGKHGGMISVAKKLGLAPSRVPPDHWKEFGNLANALKPFISKNKRMPSHTELSKAGRSDLGRAIEIHGGYLAVARKLGVEPSTDAKPMGYWLNFANLETELRPIINELGRLPSNQELKERGLTGLGRAIMLHGGRVPVARKLGVAYTGQEFVTPRTASSVEHTARAIQPLAESNLLSGAQVMVILRRAGLLDYRNQRILRLNAGLARRKHEEIESAIANLVSGGEEIAVEPVTVAESDVLSAEEAEALASVGLDPSRGVQLNAPATPDTQREQSVIRGLSALGELRLPLDQVLQLLTSKILWQSFYKRLYTWYGSLDAAQTVTPEDVDAAILSAYPEHAANEFVAEASALFTYEVEQAVNFAASLADLGWCGPRLRLHQADAARRMAETLGRDIQLNVPTDASFILNADDPGMGKSASFLAAVCAAGIANILLIAPKTVADDTWCAPRGEIRQRLPHARIVRSIADTLSAQPNAQPTFYVLHYEELLNDDAVAQLAARNFDCLCLDEIHYIKQRAAQTEPTARRSALETLRASARTAIGLTGTPLINELAEPLSLMQTLSQHAPQFDHARLSSRRMSDIADVFESLLPHIIRRRKDETLLHLLGCDVRPVPIPLPPDIDAQMLDIYTWTKSRAGEALVALRKISADAKLAYLLNRAQSARKLLVLTYLTDDVSQKIADYLDDFLPSQVAHINGQTPKAERTELLNSFRRAGGTRVLVGTIGTIGVGLTLFDPKSDETTNEIIFADLPYTYAEFDQGVARLYREGQKQRVRVDVLQTTTTRTLRDGSPLRTIDERIWDFIEGKRELAEIAIDGKYDTTDAASKVQKALRRWLKQAREIGVEPLAVERRREEQSDAEKWRGEIGRLRGMSASQADTVFADREYTRKFLEHLQTSTAAHLSHRWLRGKLSLLMRPDLAIVDMGCGLNPFADLPCRVIGLDRHDLPGQVRGKMENPPLSDKSADVLIYSLSLYGTATDLCAYFTHARRILRGGGHLFIVEPDSAFLLDGLARFIGGLRQFGFELVGTAKELRGEDGTLLKGMHLTLTGEMGKPEETNFERKNQRCATNSLAKVTRVETHSSGSRAESA